MFFHNFYYSLKVLLKNKNLIFWTFAFPIVLGFLFNLAFKDVEKSEAFKAFDIAVVTSDEFSNNPVYVETYKSLSEGENKVFNISYVDLSQAKEMLGNKDIVGYLEFKDGVFITVNQSGVNETILRYIVDEVDSNILMISLLVQKRLEGVKTNDFDALITEIRAKVLDSNVVILDKTRDNMSYTMIEYYTLIAMSALYGGTLSMYILNKKLANMGGVGKRTSMAAIKKGSLLISSLFASYVVQVLELLIVFLFTIFVIKVDYGSNLFPVVLLSLIGSLTGLALGILIATLFTSNENTKLGILIAVTMAGCFLSGMMGITMKYVVDTYVPVVNMLNPASLITDGFYTLYYYGVDKRFIIDAILLLVLAAFMIIISYTKLRRQKYDSI